LVVFVPLGLRRKGRSPVSVSLDPAPEGLAPRERAPRVTIEAIIEATDAKLTVGDDAPEVALGVSRSHHGLKGPPQTCFLQRLSVDQGLPNVFRTHARGIYENPA